MSFMFKRRGRKRLEKPKQRILLSLDQADVAIIDRMIRDGAYTNRSDAVRDIVRNVLRGRER